MSSTGLSLKGSSKVKDRKSFLFTEGFLKVEYKFEDEKIICQIVGISEDCDHFVQGV